MKDIRINKGIPASFVYNKLGIAKDTFEKMESGQTSLRVEWLPVLSEVYGLSIKDLINMYFEQKKLSFFLTNEGEIVAKEVKEVLPDCMYDYRGKEDEEQEVLTTCEECGEDIYNGEHYYKVDGNDYCQECMSEFRRDC